MVTSRHPNSSSQRVSAWNSAFNNRDIDGALELMTEDVNWHNASEGIRRQWSEFDPHVEPLAMVEEDGDKVRVTVHQLVKSLRGAVLPDSEVLHVFHCEQRPYRGHGPRGSDRSNRWSICRVRSSILIRFGAGSTQLHSRLPGTQHELITLRIFEDC